MSSVPTPWAAFAFHPIDGYVQSLPYHIFPMLFPLHKKLYVGRACLTFTMFDGQS